MSKYASSTPQIIGNAIEPHLKYKVNFMLGRLKRYVQQIFLNYSASNGIKAFMTCVTYLSSAMNTKYDFQSFSIKRKNKH